MAVSARSRKLIDPFNDKVRERIFGFGSRMSNASCTSGSEHDADLKDAAASPSSSACSASPRLSYLVQNFLESAGGAGDPTASFDGGDSEDDCTASDPTDLIREAVDPILRRNADCFRTDLLAHVTSAAEMFSLCRQNPTVFNRSVMAYLREIGYNAGVCKTKWEAASSGGLIDGSYEFIDVMERNSRYVIDLNFAEQFVISRETDRYRRVIGALPRLFVGKPDDLKRIVRITAGELKRSMKINEMSLPPWRKSRYMQAKWFGPYHRTVNQLPSSGAASQPAVQSISAVKCRSIGFFTSAVDGGRLVVAPPTTRTR